jgi:3-hydroxybutyrate dehydrogenase
MNGRVALVTGGGRGIGREVALLLAAAQARVMIVSRTTAELQEVGLEYVTADLGTAAGCDQAVVETERRLGPIDILVVNHGIGSAHERLVWEQDPQVWRDTMRINLDGPFELARLTVGGMCQRRFGRLVFTSSTAGEKAERAGSAYTASKHGLIGLARAVAQDAGPFARMGTHGDGGAFCEVGGGPARNQHGRGMARACRYLSAQARTGTYRGGAGDCIPVQ